VGRTCANGAKNAGFSEWYKFVNAYVKRDKKNLKLAVFGIQVAAFLIDFFVSRRLF